MGGAAPEELDGTAGTFSLTAVAASEEDEEARRNELQKRRRTCR